MTFKPNPRPAKPMSIPQGIAVIEGFYAEGETPNRPQRNHNPGNIRWGPFAQMRGATHGDDDGFAVFLSDADGFAALDALLGNPLYRMSTIECAINRYAPPSENDTAGYVTLLCELTGRKSTDIIGEHLNA